MRSLHTALGGLALLAVAALSGCGMHIPSDPHGTVERAENGTLRVGATENPPWVELDAADDPTGAEPELLTRFADELGAEVAWTTGSEAELMSALERGELDVVVGGFLDDTPWVERGAVTRPYAEESTEHGTEKHVIIVRMGENRLLTELETFLHEEAGS